MANDLAQEMSAANQRASAAMVATKRLRAWFDQYPNHPGRSRSMWEAEQEEQRALDEFVRLRNQQTRSAETPSS